MRLVAQRPRARVQPRAEIEPHHRSASMQRLVRHADGLTALDPAQLRRRDASGPRCGGNGQSAITTGVTKLAPEPHERGARELIATIEQSL